MVLEVFTHQFRIRFRYAKILKLTKIILNFLSTAKRTKKNEQKKYYFILSLPLSYQT